MRPKKERWVRCAPGERCFQPLCRPTRELEGVVISLDEFEAMRLTHLEGHDQEGVARLMKVHRSTVSRMLASANQKVTDALVGNKAIKIEGGCCKVVAPRGKKR